MTDAPEIGRENAGLLRQGAGMTAPDLGVWFMREVLPLEAVLTQYLHRNWRNESDIVDLRQDVYVRIWIWASTHTIPGRRAFMALRHRRHRAGG